MRKTVYLLGAGTNQVVTDWHGLRPPLANNFFQMALKSDKFKGEHYLSRIAPLYDYISQFWKKSIDDLQNDSFNLEDCFTMLQIQMNEAERIEDFNKYGQLATIEFLFESFLAEYLADFETSAVTSDSMRKFGAVIFKEQPTILTLNYDCILESVIEIASGVNISVPESFVGRPDEKGAIPDNELYYSHSNWNRPLAYGIRFDEVQLHRAGLSTYMEGRRFYSNPNNKIYNWKILKLHGSLNWFHYIPVRKYPHFYTSDETLPEEKFKEVLLIRGHWWFAEPPDYQGWLIRPLIITPVLYKEQFYEHPVFADIWRQGLQELHDCEKLVVIGYSFAPGDFHVKKLFLEAFSDNCLEELDVVDPDTRVVGIVKELTHFSKPVRVCKDLQEYLIICDS